MFTSQNTGAEEPPSTAAEGMTAPPWCPELDSSCEAPGIHSGFMVTFTVIPSPLSKTMLPPDSH